MSMMCLTSKEVALVVPSLIANNFVSRAVVLPRGALNDNTYCPSLQKCVAEMACMLLGGMTLASVITTRMEESVEAC